MTGFVPLAEPHVSRKPIAIQRLNDDTVRIDVRRTSTRVHVDGAAVERASAPDESSKNE